MISTQQFYAALKEDFNKRLNIILAGRYQGIDSLLVYQLILGISKKLEHPETLFNHAIEPMQSNNCPSHINGINGDLAVEEVKQQEFLVKLEQEMEQEQQQYLKMLREGQKLDCKIQSDIPDQILQLTRDPVMKIEAENMEQIMEEQNCQEKNHYNYEEKMQKIISFMKIRKREFVKKCKIYYRDNKIAFYQAIARGRIQYQQCLKKHDQKIRAKIYEQQMQQKSKQIKKNLDVHIVGQFNSHSRKDYARQSMIALTLENVFIKRRQGKGQVFMPKLKLYLDYSQSL